MLDAKKITYGNEILLKKMVSVFFPLILGAHEKRFDISNLVFIFHS